MQTDFDKEMDKILRAHGAARRRSTTDAKQAGATLNETQATTSANLDALHLDADALSAYIENSLPAATRALYTAHLSDCRACRQLAVALAADSPILTKEQATETAPTISTANVAAHAAKDKSSESIAKEQSAANRAQSAIKLWLAAIFAPRVMRYAVPVLILGAVGVVSFIALRSSQRSELREPSFAGSQESEKQSARPSATNSAATANGSEIEKSNSSATTNETNLSAERNFARASKDVAANPKAPAIKVAPTPPESSPGAARKSEEQAQADARDNLAPTPTPVVANSNIGVFAGRQAQNLNSLNDEVARAYPKQAAKNPPPEQNGQTANLNAQEAEKSAGGANKNVAQTESNKSATANQTRAGRARRSAPSTAKRAQTDDQDKERRVESGVTAANPSPRPTRKVAGHRFHRQGSAWIDEIYNQQQIINVARDSEQFRALAADEPVIRQIADELAGEVIVVLHGRAYRIE